MKPLIRIAFASGHVYEVPTQLLADDQAEFRQLTSPSEFPTAEAALAATVALFADDNEIVQWLRTNMNWSELQPQARLVRFNPPPLALSQATVEPVDAPALVGELTGDEMLLAPLEMALTSMHASGQLCSVSVLNDAEGKPHAAVIVAQGTADQVADFVSAAQITTDHVMAKAEPILSDATAH